MKFLMMVGADMHARSDAPPNPKLMEAIGKLAAEEMKAGKLVYTGGLGYRAPGTRLAVREGKLTQTDGPFTETKELIAGFAIFDLPSHEEAVKHAEQFMKLHQEILGPKWEGTMQIHRIFEHE